MNNVYILLELAKLDSEVYNLLMRASKPFNMFINSNIGLRATIRDSFLTRLTGWSDGIYRQCVFEFKGKVHRLDGPAMTTVVTGKKHKRTVHTWCIMGKVARHEFIDHQNEPSD